MYLAVEINLWWGGKNLVCEESFGKIFPVVGSKQIFGWWGWLSLIPQ